MNVVVNDRKNTKLPPFPCLMIHYETGTVIIATGYGLSTDKYIGTCVSPKQHVGKYDAAWSSDYVPFSGTVTISSN